MTTNEYAATIEQLRALGHDDHPGIGQSDRIYSSRQSSATKLSQDCQFLSGRLKADPNHVLTWNYYGLWQIGGATTRAKAEYHLKGGSLRSSHELRLRGKSVFGGGAGKTARHRSHLAEYSRNAIQRACRRAKGPCLSVALSDIQTGLENARY
jgi:hypothetical protein